MKKIGLSFALFFFLSSHASADQIVTLFTQSVAFETVGSYVPNSIDVGLGLCTPCFVNPSFLANIGPFGPFTAQPVSETLTIGPSNPAFAPIVAFLQSPSASAPPFFALFPYFSFVDSNGTSDNVGNAYGIGPLVVPTGTIDSLLITVPEISRFQLFSGEIGGPVWAALGPNGEQVSITWQAEGINLPEPAETPMLLLGIYCLFIWRLRNCRQILAA